jgi:hypothetical protein
VRCKAQRVRLALDRWKGRAAEEFHRNAALEAGESQPYVLNESREVGDDQDLLLAPASEVSQDGRVRCFNEFHLTAAERLIPSSQRNQSLHPRQERISARGLQFDVNRLVVILIIDDWRQEQALFIPRMWRSLPRSLPRHLNPEATRVDARRDRGRLQRPDGFLRPRSGKRQRKWLPV